MVRFFKATFLLLLLTPSHLHSGTRFDDGYDLWLSYQKLTDVKSLAACREHLQAVFTTEKSPSLDVAIHELQTGLQGMLDRPLPTAKGVQHGVIILATGSSTLTGLDLTTRLKQIGDEGYLVFVTTIDKKRVTVIAANTHVGVLYGVFHLLQLVRTKQSLDNLNVSAQPKIKRRVLNHWDNLDRTVERGYAGASIWNWHTLPDYIDPRYIDYARANASIGINGTVLTNVNANALLLTPAYLRKVAALADVFRPYGIRVYLTARFSAPIELDGLPTADPLDPQVKAWWTKKAEEIYRVVPDFGGFLVKANSEGQPGPQTYGRSHADGANMLADALGPFGGVVMWRAFVYDTQSKEDRARQAYTEFKPLDGAFRKNVIVQVKNGPVDFQPREPFHPLFGAMPRTPLMMEFQITQEYLGFSTHLVYLATLFKECLDADTGYDGKVAPVSGVIDGSLDGHTLTGIAGVANIGSDRNWCGHPFAQANWYAFGRLAWNYALTPDQIADEWIRSTFTTDEATVGKIKSMMMKSREVTVNYMTPLGLHHIMGYNHHYGPGPWIKDKPRPEWTSVYYHKADSLGVGFDRTAKGSNALAQYAPPVAKKFADPENCPEEFLLWFHHVPWDYKTRSGQTLWDAMVYHYYSGAAAVDEMLQTWLSMKEKIDPGQFDHVRMLLEIQQKEAVWWRDACVLYFQTFSKRPIPAGLEKAAHTLQYYEELSFPYAPGISPKW